MREKDAALLGRFCVGTVAVISGQVVIDDVADLVKRRGLEEDLRLLLEEISGHVDDEGLILHLFITDHLREDVANRRRIVARLFGVVDDPQDDLVAGAQSRQRFGDLALVRGDLGNQSPFSDAVLRDSESGVTGWRLSASRAKRSQQQGGRAGEGFTYAGGGERDVARTFCEQRRIPSRGGRLSPKGVVPTPTVVFDSAAGQAARAGQVRAPLRGREAEPVFRHCRRLVRLGLK